MAQGGPGWSLGFGSQFSVVHPKSLTCPKCQPAHGYMLSRENDSFVNSSEDESSTLALALTPNLRIPGASFVCPGCQSWAHTAGPGSHVRSQTMYDGRPSKAGDLVSHL